MDDPIPNPRAAGPLLALAIFVGVIAGAIIGQPSAGFVGGVVIGTMIAIALWLADRRRIGR